LKNKSWISKRSSGERRRVIDQAKKLQFEATDRTKEFHAALGFVEVLKERELQLEAKKQREKIHLAAETDYQAQMRAEIDAATKFEAERVLQRKSNNKNNQKDLESQIRYRKDQKLAEKEADVIEGETLAQLASVEKSEKDRKKEIEIEQRKEMKFLLDKQLEMNREFQQEVTKTDKIEEDKRKIYTKAKDEMSSMRQAKIAEIFKTQQERRGQLAAKLAKEYKEAEDDIEERMEKARKEKDEKQEKIDAEKREKRTKALEEIKKHLQLQLQVKDLAREERRKMDLRERSEKEKADNIFKNAQKKKMESKRSKNEEVAKDLISKVNAQAADERRTRELQLALEQKQLESMKKEEDEFQQYASEIIKQAEKTERNSFPLKVVAAKGPGGGHGPVNPITGLRPSYLSSDAFGNQMPTYKNDQTNEIRRNVEPGSAKTGKRRLGFTW